MLDALPENATDSIYVRERIERARREAVEGTLIDESEIEDLMRQWLDE